MKPGSKRRRPKAQIQEEKRRAQAEKEEIERKMAQFDELQAFKEEFEPKRKRLVENSSILEQLYAEGSIQEIGDGSLDIRKDI